MTAEEMAQASADLDAATRERYRRLLRQVADFGVSFTGDGRFFIPVRYPGGVAEAVVIQAGEIPGDVRIDLPDGAKRAGSLLLSADVLGSVIAAAGGLVDG
jgi:hypothetical protein